LDEVAIANTKEETTSSLSDKDVRAMTTFGTSVHTNQRKVMVVHLDQLHLIREPLRMSNTGKEGKSDHRRHKHGPRKRINGGTPVGSNVAYRLVDRQRL
jgi:hypothetical protein